MLLVSNTLIKTKRNILCNHVLFKALVAKRFSQTQQARAAASCQSFHPSWPIVLPLPCSK